MSRWTAADVRNVRAKHLPTSKYRNVKVEVDGLTFDSKKEAARWRELTVLQKIGTIQGLERQRGFSVDLVGKDGNLHHICDYLADFYYWERQHVGAVEWAEPTIEDVKSPATRKKDVYRLKKKLVEAIYGITIRET